MKNTQFLVILALLGAILVQTEESQVDFQGVIFIWKVSIIKCPTVRHWKITGNSYKAEMWSSHNVPTLFQFQLIILYSFLQFNLWNTCLDCSILFLVLKWYLLEKYQEGMVAGVWDGINRKKSTIFFNLDFFLSI